MKQFCRSLISTFLSVASARLAPVDTMELLVSKHSAIQRVFLSGLIQMHHQRHQLQLKLRVKLINQRLLHLRQEYKICSLLGHGSYWVRRRRIMPTSWQRHLGLLPKWSSIRLFMNHQPCFWSSKHISKREILTNCKQLQLRLASLKKGGSNF